MAVFTDGFLYHRDRIGDDLAHRMALVRSGRFLVWSLTWKDVENQFKQQSDYFENLIDPGKTPGGALFNTLVDGYGLQGLKGAIKEGSFTCFIRYLADPNEELWGKFAYAAGLCFLDAKRFSAPESVSSWQERLESESPAGIRSILREKLSESILGLYCAENKGLTGFSGIYAAAEKSSTAGPKTDGMRFFCCFGDEDEERQKSGFESAWTGMLRAYNLFQFLPRAFFASSRGVRANLYDELVTVERIPEKPGATPSLSEEWREVKKLVDPEVHGLIDQVAANGCPVPEPGFELMAGTGEIVASAELAWEEMKVALLREDETGYRALFEGAGWTVFLLAEVLMNPDQLCVMLKG